MSEAGQLFDCGRVALRARKLKKVVTGMFQRPYGMSVERGKRRFRITVRDVLGSLGSAISEDQILDDHPQWAASAFPPEPPLSKYLRILNPMTFRGFIAPAFLICVSIAGAELKAQVKNTAYPAMAPLDLYLIQDEKAEVALARTAAPPSISSGAEAMVLGRAGYRTAAKGSNGFVCIVDRSWGASTDDAEFWNPKVRAPICFYPQSARSFLPIYLMKTKLVLAGKSKGEILHATALALDNHELPAIQAGAMCYMLSKQQYLNDKGMS